jgi:hypothetical protein
MDRLTFKCEACGETFRVAEKDGARMIDFRFWGASLARWLDQHHEHADQSKLLHQQFTLEEVER